MPQAMVDFSSKSPASSNAPAIHVQGHTGRRGRLTIEVAFPSKPEEEFRTRREEGNVIVDINLADIAGEGPVEDTFALYVNEKTPKKGVPDIHVMPTERDAKMDYHGDALEDHSVGDGVNDKEVRQDESNFEHEMAQSVEKFMDTVADRLNREE
ncbi:hypothetical protein QFC22_004935 [Naganishia vaughanmartiniae]|uniref:Uncharacterized protein n=1 Tax=Naganishia vaughanmartiniae TaxID=1424756 RepID=A0ACC2WYD1_9TREE|nr:hypothetical protein QFC22_004935 [Naganishia vaughanmartiniae]